MLESEFQLSFLDGPTLAFVAVCIAALLGLFLVLAWLQQRDMRALAWWGAAYLIGASSLALWAAPRPYVTLPAENGGNWQSESHTNAPAKAATGNRRRPRNSRTPFQIMPQATKIIANGISDGSTI